MDKQYIDTIVEAKSINVTDRTLVALASTETEDRDGEVIETKGWGLKAYQANPVVMLAHNYAELPIAKALWVKKTKEGLKFKPQFANTPLAQEVFDLYKDGFMKAFSVGFMPIEWTDGDGKKGPKRTYTKTELLEISAVAIPANSEALRLAVSEGRIKTKALLDVVNKLMPSGDDSHIDMDVDGEPAVSEPESKADGEGDYESVEPETVTKIQKLEDEVKDLYGQIRGVIKENALLRELLDSKKRVVNPDINIEEPDIDIGAIVNRHFDRITGHIS